jgi:hypothetical protein
MAIYNAYCDRVPAIVILGNEMDSVARRSFVEWSHSAQDAAVIIRDYTKWDERPPLCSISPNRSCAPTKSR